MKTRDKVLSAARQLGYVVDVNAASLRSGRTNSVGVVVRDFSSPLYAAILAGIESVLDSQGLTMLVLNSHGDGERSEDLVRTLQERRVDGVILSLDNEMGPDLTQRVIATRLPVVLVDRDLPRRPPGNWGAVQCDHFSGVTAAMQALLNAEHTRIAFVGGPPIIRPWQERLRAYREALAEAGIRGHSRYEVLESNAEAAAERIVSLLRTSKARRPTALLVGGAQMCLSTLNLLHDNAVTLGSDVSLVTCDDLDLLRLMTPPIDVVDRDRLLLGRKSALLLQDLLRGETGRVEMIPTTYLARGSVRTPANTSRPRGESNVGAEPRS